VPEAETLPTMIDRSGAVGDAAYGVAAPGIGLESGHHRSGSVVDPDQPGLPEPALVEAAARWVARRYPTADTRPLSAETCLYTNTPDETFVCRRHDRVVVGSACSGHGFKFAPATGMHLAQLAIEAQPSTEELIASARNRCPAGKLPVTTSEPGEGSSA
jgi:glycine/D-amino acid oxidase-like deaminating enzyme